MRQDPTEILDQYGADALRLYLVNSPVVHAETLKFKKEGVFGVVKDVFLPWYNAYRFLVQNVLRLEAESGQRFYPSQVGASSMRGPAVPCSEAGGVPVWYNGWLPCAGPCPGSDTHAEFPRSPASLLIPSAVLLRNLRALEGSDAGLLMLCTGQRSNCPTLKVANEEDLNRERLHDEDMAAKS